MCWARTSGSGATRPSCAMARRCGSRMKVSHMCVRVTHTCAGHSMRCTEEGVTSRRLCWTLYKGARTSGRGATSPSCAMASKCGSRSGSMPRNRAYSTTCGHTNSQQAVYNKPSIASRLPIRNRRSRDGLLTLKSATVRVSDGEEMRLTQPVDAQEPRVLHHLKVNAESPSRHSTSASRL